MSEIDELLEEQLQNEEFAQAWQETALEDQVKRIILNARIDNNLTQEQLALKSGVRQSNISRIENGSSLPTLRTLDAIAKSLGKRVKIEIV